MEAHWEHIEKYLAGEMAKKERENFEKAMEENEALAEEVTLVKNMTNGIRLYGNTKLKVKLDEIHEKTIKSQPNTQPRSFTVNRVMAIAATVALLITAYGIWQWNAQIPLSTQALYDQYQETYSWDFHQRGNQESNLGTAYQLYKEQAFSAFVDEIKQQSIDLSENPPLALALGYAFEAIGQGDKARTTYQIAEKNPLFKQEALWYQALSFLKEDNREATRRKLQLIISGDGSVYVKKATELLEKL